MLCQSFGAGLTVTQLFRFFLGGRLPDNEDDQISVRKDAVNSSYAAMPEEVMRMSHTWILYAHHCLSLVGVRRSWQKEHSPVVRPSSRFANVFCRRRASDKNGSNKYQFTAVQLSQNREQACSTCVSFRFFAE